MMRKLLFFLLALLNFHFSAYSHYFDKYVDNQGNILQFEQVTVFSTSYSLCRACELKKRNRPIQKDVQEALKNAIALVYYRIDAPFYRDYDNYYVWQKSFYDERINSWVANYFTREPLKKALQSDSIELYSEYAQRFNYLYYWFNICREVEILWLKKLCAETEKEIEKSKNDNSYYDNSNREAYIAYLEKDLKNYYRQISEVPKFFADSVRILVESFEKTTDELFFWYNKCLKRHKNLNILYERGKIYFDRGETIDFVNDIFTLVDLGYSPTSEMNVELGKAYNEAHLYNHAIKILSETIQKNPHLKEAYFQRAVAFFETGNLQLALSDYLSFGNRPHVIDDPNYQHFKFSLGVGLGCLRGSLDSATEFFPSLFSTIYGLGKGLWVFAADPIGISKEFIENAIACVDYIKHDLTPEILSKLVPELKECIQKWDQLEEEKKGYYIGYAIGRYGVDSLICGAGVKAIQLCRNVKRANTLLTFETAIASPANTETLARASDEFFAWRSEFKKKCKLHVGQQEKHIPGSNNFQAGKSELTISLEKMEELASSKLGEGIPSRFSFGEAGYREIIDFGEEIGEHVHKETKIRTKTTIGEIHYDKDGRYHIVPVHPNRFKIKN